LKALKSFIDVSIPLIYRVESPGSMPLFPNSYKSFNILIKFISTYYFLLNIFLLRPTKYTLEFI